MGLGVQTFFNAAITVASTHDRSLKRELSPEYTHLLVRSRSEKCYLMTVRRLYRGSPELPALQAQSRGKSIEIIGVF